jgi:hypothetical protein
LPRRALSSQWPNVDATNVKTLQCLGRARRPGDDELLRSRAQRLRRYQFGRVGPGWTFTVALTGQDGFNSDQARAFASTPQDFSFGVCQPGGSSPICAVDPGTVPKVMDTFTPAGVDQATELDPTRGPVVLQGVTVP